ncbi:MAG TPA: ParB/RepB/Spo0J family partition protein [Nitrososphaera sp.]|nr:ParB/RepB/Spo0J family partition protein [Nitrososphaera sp.]
MESEQTIFNVPTKGIVTEILVSKIRHSNFLLRDVNISLDQLQDSIVQQGLLQPIIVRMVNDEEYEVVAGNRRFAACKQLGWKRIMCHVLELDERNAFEVSLIENLQHNTLNPVEEAHAYKRYVEGHGWGSVSELAQRVGKSHSHVSNRIRLLALPQEILDQIVCRRTNPGTIQEILGIRDKELRVIVAKEVIDHDLRREEVRNLIRGNIGEDLDHLSNKYSPSQQEILLREKEKAIFRFITTLRIALIRLDDTMEAIDTDDWVLWQNLMHYRTNIHKQIDELIVLKKKTKLHLEKLGSL